MNSGALIPSLPLLLGASAGNRTRSAPPRVDRGQQWEIARLHLPALQNQTSDSTEGSARRALPPLTIWPLNPHVRTLPGRVRSRKTLLSLYKKDLHGIRSRTWHENPCWWSGTCPGPAEAFLNKSSPHACFEHMPQANHPVPGTGDYIFILPKLILSKGSDHKLNYNQRTKLISRNCQTALRGEWTTL